MGKFTIYVFMGMILMIITSCVMAADKDDQSFQQGIEAAAKHRQSSIDTFKSFNPKDTFKNYTDSPEPSHYYGGVTQSSTPLKEDAVANASNSESGKAVKQADEHLKAIDKVALANEIKRISAIQDHADDIVKGISDEFVDCTKQESCTTTYEEKQCEESPDSLLQYCKKILNIDLIPHQEETHYSLTLHLSVKKHNYAGVTFNATNAQIGFLGPHDASFSLDGRLPTDVDCKTLQGKVVSTKSNANLDTITFPTCSSGLSMDLHISGGHYIDIQVDIVSTKITYEPKDRWEDGCLGLANNSSCVFQTEQCVSSQATHVIQNIPVARDCWEKEASYLCRGGSGGGTSVKLENSCAPLRDQGCEQMNSVCEEKTDGGCNKYLQTFRCPTKNCAVTGAICNGKTYCLDGDCVKSQKQADPDFQQAVSALSASMDAAKQFDQQFIFKGQSKSCRNFMLGAAYCCKDDGWLIDSNLMDCSQEEKELGHAKENGLTHYVGRYEEGCAAGVCLKKIKAYCVFPSKLARIIQEQGLEQQLGRHFGGAESPDCSGLTPEDLQKIDFSRIDFKEFYADIAKKESIEDQEQLNKRIQDKMKWFIDEGKSHDEPQH